MNKANRGDYFRKYYQLHASTGLTLPEATTRATGSLEQASDPHTLKPSKEGE